jgi:hypothetical protein
VHKYAVPVTGVALFFRGSEKLSSGVIVTWQVVHPEDGLLFGEFLSLVIKML